MNNYLPLFFAFFFAATVSCKEEPKVTPQKNSPVVCEKVQVLGHDCKTVVPKNLEDNSPVLIVASTGSEYESKVTELSVAEGFRACLVTAGAKDDADFLKEVKALFPDAPKYYLLGFKAAGVVAYKAAMSMPAEFNAFGCVSGGMDAETFWNSDFEKAVPFVHVHGTKDPVYNWNGSQSELYASVPLCVNRITAANKSVRSEKGSILPLGGGCKVNSVRYFGRSPEAEVLFYTIEGGTDNWDENTLDTIAVIWNFFIKH